MPTPVHIKYLARAFVDAQSTVVTLNDAAALGAQLHSVVGAPLFPQPIVEGSPTGPIRRFGLMSPYGDWQVALLSQSFDVALHETDVTQPKMAPLVDFVGQAGIILSRLAAHFGRTPWRLALVLEGVVRELALSQASTRFLQPLPTFRDSELLEWEHRALKREAVTISGRAEQLNVIAVVGRTPATIHAPTGHQQQIETLRYEFDVNTLPTETRGRFGGPADVQSFLDAAMAKIETVEREVLDALAPTQ